MQQFLDYIWTLFYGIIEGITEWLPVSSTGHLIIFENFTSPSFSEAFLEMFRVVIQLGAILAVVVLFWEKIWPFHTAKNPDTFKFKKETSLTKLATKYVYMDKIILWLKIAVACLPAIIIGLPFDDILDTYLYNAYVVAATLIIYGVLFIVIEKWRKNKPSKINDLSEIDFKIAALIGAFQVLAMIPGTSRSGSTILGAMLLCCSRTAAAEFSFLLGIPVMFGASGLKAVKFFLDGNAFQQHEILILVFGMVVAFVVSMLSIKFLMNFVKKHDFKCFGYYRIVLGVILILLGVFTTVL